MHRHRSDMRGMDGSDEPGFGAAECRFCRFGVGFGPPLMAPRPASYAALQLSTSPVIRGRPVIVGNADSAATMAGCAMPCVEKMRVAKGLALGLTVSKAADFHEALSWRARQHSAARRVAERRLACSVRIRCQGRSARQQQRCFGYQPQRRWQLDDDDGRCTGTEACPPGTGNVVL